MNINPKHWRAGWYTIPGEKVTFASRHHPAAPWHEASTWLRQEMHSQASFWEPSECFSLHVDSGQVMGNLAFNNCLDFIEWALANRQGRGIWGRDAHRCYYLIVHEGGDSGDRAQLNADVTPPLMTQAGLAMTPEGQLVASIQ